MRQHITRAVLALTNYYVFASGLVKADNHPCGAYPSRVATLRGCAQISDSCSSYLDGTVTFTKTFTKVNTVPKNTKTIKKTSYTLTTTVDGTTTVEGPASTTSIDTTRTTTTTALNCPHENNARAPNPRSDSVDFLKDKRRSECSLAPSNKRTRAKIDTGACNCILASSTTVTKTTTVKGATRSTTLTTRTLTRHITKTITSTPISTEYTSTSTVTECSTLGVLPACTPTSTPFDIPNSDFEDSSNESEAPPWEIGDDSESVKFLTDPGEAYSGKGYLEFTFDNLVRFGSYVNDISQDLGEVDPDVGYHLSAQISVTPYDPDVVTCAIYIGLGDQYFTYILLSQEHIGSGYFKSAGSALPSSSDTRLSITAFCYTTGYTESYPIPIKMKVDDLQLEKLDLMTCAMDLQSISAGVTVGQYLSGYTDSQTGATRFEFVSEPSSDTVFTVDRKGSLLAIINTNYGRILTVIGVFGDFSSGPEAIIGYPPFYFTYYGFPTLACNINGERLLQCSAPTGQSQLGVRDNTLYIDTAANLLLSSTDPVELRAVYLNYT